MTKGHATPEGVKAAILDELRRDHTRPNRVIGQMFGVTYQVVQSVRRRAGLPEPTQKDKMSALKPMTADELKRLEDPPYYPYKDRENFHYW
jgi:hypothetical protein